MSAANSYIGSPVERVEDLRFLRGRGQYIDDFTREGVLYAAVLRSAVAHGRIRSIDARPALALPGIHSVLTAADIGPTVPLIPLRLQPMTELEPFHQPVIAHDKVRYVGEPIAVVLAESAALAEDALDAIAVEIDALPAVVERQAAIRGQTLLFDEMGSNRPITYSVVSGDAETAFKAAEYVRRESFRVQRHSAVPMEPRGVLALWDAATARLIVHGAAKVPFFNRRILAQQMGLAEDAIDMIELDVGGGFGVRGEFYPEDFLIPFAARLVGRPVKWTEDRREHLLATNHARDMECDIEIACKRDGTILGLRGRTYSDLGAYIRTNGMVGPRNVAQFLSGPYRIPNIAIEAWPILTNKTPAGTYRGPGRFEADFFRERLIDLVAKDLGIDRVELRRRNLVSDAEMPYPLPKITPYESITELDSGDYHAVLDRCLTEFGWTEKAALSGKLIDGRYHGTGIACFIEGGAAGPKETARFVIETDGSVSAYVGSSALGQGLETVFAQIAADALEMPMQRIRVFHGSTTYVSEGFGSYHSRASVMGGSALLLAATKLKEEIRAAAAKRFGCPAAEIEITEDRVRAAGGHSLTLAELAADGLSAEASFTNKKYTYSYGAHAAHVAVDPKTGRVAILDYLAVEDVGRIMNPLTLHGQVIGSLVQGLGGTFLEHLVYDANGQLLTGSFADYLMPTASDFPNLRAISLELKPSPNNPLGAKGAGEGGIISAGAVSANAVASALAPLGCEPRDLPLSPPRIWELVQEAQHTPKAAE